MGRVPSKEEELKDRQAEPRAAAVVVVTEWRNGYNGVEDIGAPGKWGRLRARPIPG
jgi:hypothetical protein